MAYDHYSTVQLVIDGNIVAQRKTSRSKVKQVIDHWKKIYALRYKNYEIWATHPSLLNYMATKKKEKILNKKL